SGTYRRRKYTLVKLAMEEWNSPQLLYELAADIVERRFNNMHPEPPHIIEASAHDDANCDDCAFQREEPLSKILFDDRQEKVLPSIITFAVSAPASRPRRTTIPPVTNNLQVDKTLPTVPKTIPRVTSQSKLQRESINSIVEDTAGVDFLLLFDHNETYGNYHNRRLRQISQIRKLPQANKSPATNLTNTQINTNKSFSLTIKQKKTTQTTIDRFNFGSQLHAMVIMMKTQIAADNEYSPGATL
ncbi:4139_t:CDS:2, partial [Paraglomus occultum]